MKLSLSTLAVLLSAAAVHALPALPAGPPTPPPAISDDMKDGLESAGDGAGLIVNSIVQGIPNLIGGIKDAQERKKAWHSEQERKKAEEDEEALREALEDRRRIAVDKLEHAEDLQDKAEACAGRAQRDHEAAIESTNRAREELARLAERHKAAAAELRHAEEQQAQAEAAAAQAAKDRDDAVKVADVLREDIAQIDETDAVVGIPDDERYLVNPDDYPKPPPEAPEEPEGKHHHKHHRHD